MLPSPTPELLLILAGIRQHLGEDAVMCSEFLNGMLGRLRTAQSSRKVVGLREFVPEMEIAESGARSAIGALCLICPLRARCPGPVQ